MGYNAWATACVWRVEDSSVGSVLRSPSCGFLDSDSGYQACVVSTFTHSATSSPHLLNLEIHRIIYDIVRTPRHPRHVLMFFPTPHTHTHTHYWFSLLNKLTNYCVSLSWNSFLQYSRWYAFTLVGGPWQGVLGHGGGGVPSCPLSIVVAVQDYSPFRCWHPHSHTQPHTTHAYHALDILTNLLSWIREW